MGAGRWLLEEYGLSLGPLFGREVIGKYEAEVGKAQIKFLHVRFSGGHMVGQVGPAGQAGRARAFSFYQPS